MKKGLVSKFICVQSLSDQNQPAIKINLIFFIRLLFYFINFAFLLFVCYCFFTSTVTPNPYP